VNRFYKISILLLVIYSSGILYFITGKKMDESPDRPGLMVYSVFQYGSDNLFQLPFIKFNNHKDLVILNSNFFIAPIANTIASIAWSALTVLFLNLFPKKTDDPVSPLWKRIFIVNLLLSLFWFVIWSCMSQHFLLEGYYDSNVSDTGQLLNWVAFIFFIPSHLPYLIADIWLAHGSDSSGGYQNLYLTSQTASAFSTITWSLASATIYQQIKEKTYRKVY